MVQWHHKCDENWLKARQRYLTATDIKDLLPITKTGRPRSVSKEDYLKVLARKLTKVDASSCESSGAMARGHILEPFAIDAYNEREIDKLFHWDDAVIGRNNQPYCLGFSPDALDVKQPDGVSFIASDISPKALGEVKSYSPERHLACASTDPENLEERWQVAAAMACCDTIEKASLIFFNPSLQWFMFVAEYTRADLSNEIDMCLNIEEDWLYFFDRWTPLSLPNKAYGTENNLMEKAIVDKIIEKEKLNPSGIRTVIR